MSQQVPRRLLDVFSVEQLTASFVKVHEIQEAARTARQRKQEEIEARRRRPMTTTTKGLSAQIAAAQAASRHAQDAALAERRREKELAAVQDEVRAERRNSTRNGG